MIETPILSIFDGKDKAYIYLWVSKTHKLVYVGMTNGFSGTLGRAGAHVSKRGTLRKRCLERKGHDLNEVKDFKLLSFKLPESRKYISDEKSYREAVEYLVQKKLLEGRANFDPVFEVVSWVRDSPRTGNAEVKRLANEIYTEFKAYYEN